MLTLGGAPQAQRSSQVGAEHDLRWAQKPGRREKFLSLHDVLVRPTLTISLWHTAGVGTQKVQVGTATVTKTNHFSAVVIQRQPLRYTGYTEGANVDQDLPEHVRAGSSLRWFHNKLAVIQDDTSAIAWVDPVSGHVTRTPLPASAKRERQFGDRWNNKSRKLDLEASLVTEIFGQTTLVAIGSGSSPQRERLALLTSSNEQTEAILVQIHDFYESLRAEKSFSGSELNIEGAVNLTNRLLFLQRGNGAPQNDLMPVNAIGEVDLNEFIRYVESNGQTSVPRLKSITVVELGVENGARLTFTDAVAWNNQILFSAAAEASPDATHDGPVTAVALGTINTNNNNVEYCLIMDETGGFLLDKVEGVTTDPTDESKIYAVVDCDDPDKPSELLTIQLKRT